MRLMPVLGSAVLMLVARTVLAQPCHEARGPAASSLAVAPEAGRADVRLAPDTLVDQAGRAVRLPEALAGRIVVVNFVFTTCTTICPVLSSLFTSLQGTLGELLGREVLLVSVSIDPEHDTPAKMRAYAEQRGAGVGWRWLTGESSSVRRVLAGFGASVASPAAHAPFVLVGDVDAGRWTRLNGVPEKSRIEARVRELLATRRARRTGP